VAAHGRIGQPDEVAAGVGRDAAHGIGQAPGQAGPATDLEPRRRAHAEDLQRGESDPRAGCLEMLLQGVQGWRRLGFQLALPPIDGGVQAIERQGEPGGHPVQRLGDVMSTRRLTERDLVQGLAPPLEADQSGHGLVDHVADLADLVVEGIQREQRLARVGRQKQGRQVAVGIVLADLLGAVREGSAGDGSLSAGEWLKGATGADPAKTRSVVSRNLLSHRQ
jgi:hypothetical protein